MSDPDTKNPSDSDWTRFDNLEDDEIDTSDIPILDDTFFERASVRIPADTTVYLLSTEANRKHLMEALEQYERGEGLVECDLDEL